MRNYKILFVDDEEVSRRSFLSLVDWEQKQFQVVGVCKDGETALKCLKEHPVDIVISDINMPFLNGIDLLAEIRNNYPGIRVILLTGYEYFEYARKAVELKAFDFLLKPVTAERLLGAAEKAAFDIEKEEAVNQAFGRSLELSRSEFINRLFYGKIEREQIYGEAENARIPVDKHIYQVMIITVDPREAEEIHDSEANVLKQELRREILRRKELLDLRFQAQANMCFSRGVSRHIQLMVYFPQDADYVQAYMEALASQILEIRLPDMSYALTVGMGNVHTHLTELTESFKKVELALKNRHMLGLGRVIYAVGAIPERQSAESIVLPTETFLRHIRMGMTKEVEQDIKDIYNDLRHGSYLSLESAKMVTVELAITAFKGDLSPQGESVSYLYYLNHIQQLNTLDEMEEDIKHFAVNVAERRKGSGSHKKNMAEQALDYLRSNYAREELSLNDIANALNISVPYLAVLFKQETGKNFGAHLLELRMEKAMELLRTSALTIAEIAEQVGYASPQYFSVCFKKYTGLAPGAYREKK